ncbi:hypothetical protein CERSUDRAFT_91900 [Gelatoporia subvermispora B]|uniref:Uncharacterized protein n=1 Tax=Ceriporiopsis subvermispora (strain B) TaxID=914234 RepID=M2RQI5_CERS8|nr:hypothetical protein CERSUDRAFT_91900 [Gelatoporia subvermispora B]
MSKATITRPTHSRASSAQNLCLLLVNMSSSGKMTVPVVDPSTGYLSEYRLVPFDDQDLSEKTSYENPRRAGRPQSMVGTTLNSKTQSAALRRRRGAARRTLSEGGIPPIAQKPNCRPLRLESDPRVPKITLFEVSSTEALQAASGNFPAIDRLTNSKTAGSRATKLSRCGHRRQSSIIRTCPLPPSSPARPGLLTPAIDHSPYSSQGWPSSFLSLYSSPPRPSKCAPSPKSLAAGVLSRFMPTSVQANANAAQDNSDDIYDNTSFGDFDVTDSGEGFSSALAKTPARRLFFPATQPSQEISATSARPRYTNDDENEDRPTTLSGGTSGTTLVGLGFSGMLNEDGSPFTGLGTLPRTRPPAMSSPAQHARSLESREVVEEFDITDAKAPFLSYAEFRPTSDAELSALSQRFQRAAFDDAAVTPLYSPTPASRRARSLVDDEDLFIVLPGHPVSLKDDVFRMSRRSSIGAGGPSRRLVTGGMDAEDATRSRQREAKKRPHGGASKRGSIVGRREEAPERTRLDRPEERKRAAWKP